MNKHGNLVLVRHGESRWNLQNLFTGWVDVPLSDKGIEEAHTCAGHCENFEYDIAFTSGLKRAQETMLIILAHQSKTGVFQYNQETNYQYFPEMAEDVRKTIFPVVVSEKLNERFYGDLQGVDKKIAGQDFGATQLKKWRRGYRDVPPGGESLEQVFNRMIPYFEKEIHLRIKQGETVLMVGHGNTLRAVIKFLEKIDDDKIPLVDLPTGRPLVYECAGENFNRIEGDYNFDRPLR